MRFVHRQWGYYITLLDGKHFKVKILRFKTGKSCSMQYHNKRSELWCFLSGAGDMYIEGALIAVQSGDFRIVHQTYWHQFTAWLPTTVLEIQFGDKCDEKDIVRA
jgi:mannose-1-phosphate guanylyltransferase / mannose-6-phosphate isomerase